MAHTPGPWEAKPAVGRIILNGSSIYGVADITGEFARWNPDDLLLMAAAPELLSALIEVADGCEYRLRKGEDAGDRATLRLCRAAIAKATGKESE